MGLAVARRFGGQEHQPAGGENQQAVGAVVAALDQLDDAFGLGQDLVERGQSPIGLPAERRPRGGRDDVLAHALGAQPVGQAGDPEPLAPGTRHRVRPSAAGRADPVGRAASIAPVGCGPALLGGAGHRPSAGCLRVPVPAVCAAGRWTFFRRPCFGPGGRTAGVIGRFAFDADVPCRCSGAPSVLHPTGDDESVADEEYLLDNAQTEPGVRFRALAEPFDPWTRFHLSATGLRAGWHCWEVGAGGPDLPAWPADRVGPAGRVLATDIGTSWLTGHDGFEVLQHDVAADEAPGSFDLIHRRAPVRAQRANAAVMTAACSTSCTRADPADGAAIARRDSRLIPCSLGIISGNASARNVHEPWLAGSSCTQRMSVTSG